MKNMIINFLIKWKYKWAHSNNHVKNGLSKASRPIWVQKKKIAENEEKNKYKKNWLIRINGKLHYQVISNIMSSLLFHLARFE